MLNKRMQGIKCFFGLLLFLMGASVFADQTLSSGLMMPEAKTIQPFVFQQQPATPAAQAPREFTNENLKGKWTLLFFGFTNCPALCPTTMAQMANAYQQLADKKYTPLPQVVFISVDPTRDSLSKVNQFATTFNKNFIGVRTDDMTLLLRITKEMNAMFEKVPVPEGSVQDKEQVSNYTIDHTGDIMVLNPKGQFVAMLTMPHEANNIAKDYQTIVNNSPDQSSSSQGLLSGIKSFFTKK